METMSDFWSAKVLDANQYGNDADIICGIDWVAATHKDNNPRNDIDAAKISLADPTFGFGMTAIALGRCRSAACATTTLVVQWQHLKARAWASWSAISG
ncbi:hypothetical protein AB4Y72_14940 [Arthrobacter sp. YAF34]|uniref:hypothetical protein n=1 Tax=Arthrobacter sp. YAF34 TaxID=3233083 RepID=UPI003F92899E